MITIYHMENFGRIKAALTAQKLKFSIKDFFSKWDQIQGNCGFGHIYLRNT